MNNHLDLRQIPITSMELHREHIENELKGSLNFLADKELNNRVKDIVYSGKECNITYRAQMSPKEDSLEEIVTRDCYITSFNWHEDNFDELYNITLEFVTSNAGIRILSVLKSKDGKEMVVKPDIAKLVNKVCKPKDITFDNLQKVVLSCMI